MIPNSHPTIGWVHLKVGYNLPTRNVNKRALKRSSPFSLFLTYKNFD